MKKKEEALAAVKKTFTTQEGELSLIKIELHQTSEKVESAKNEAIRKFLISSAFGLAALIKVAPLFQGSLYDAVEAISAHWPFSAAEFEPANRDFPSMEGYIWNEEEDELLGPEGGSGLLAGGMSEARRLGGHNPEISLA